MKGRFFHPALVIFAALSYLRCKVLAAETAESLEAKLEELGDLGLPLPEGNVSAAYIPFKLGLKALLLDMNGLARRMFNDAESAGFQFASWGNAMSIHSSVTYEDDDLSVANYLLNKILGGKIQMNDLQANLTRAARELFMPGRSRFIRVKNYATVLKEIVEGDTLATDNFVKVFYIKALIETAQLSRDETVQREAKTALKPVLDTADNVSLRSYYFYVAFTAYNRLDEAEEVRKFANIYGTISGMPAYSFHLARTNIYIRLGEWGLAQSAISLTSTLIQDSFIYVYDSWENNYPGLDWLRVLETKHFIFLQRGEFTKGLEVLNEVMEYAGQSSNASDHLRQAFIYRMSARHYFETSQLNLPRHSLPKAQNLDKTWPNSFYTVYSEASLLLAETHKRIHDGRSTFNHEELANISARVAQMRTIILAEITHSSAAQCTLDLVDYCRYQTWALWKSANNSLPEAELYFKLAANIEERLFRGTFSMEPTFLLLPSMELYGDLLRERREKEQPPPMHGSKNPAMHIQGYYQSALELYVNRPNTVYRIASLYGDAGFAAYYRPVAVKWYTKANDNWAQADTTFDALREVREYMESKNPPNSMSMVIGLGAGAVGILIIVVVATACRRKGKSDSISGKQEIEKIKSRYDKGATKKTGTRREVAPRLVDDDSPDPYDPSHFENPSSSVGTFVHKPQYHEADVAAGVSEMTLPQTYFDNTATEITPTYERRNDEEMSTFSHEKSSPEGMETVTTVDELRGSMVASAAPAATIVHDNDNGGYGNLEDDDDDDGDDTHDTWGDDSKPLVRNDEDDASDRDHEEAPPIVHVTDFSDLDEVIASQDSDLDEVIVSQDSRVDGDTDRVVDDTLWSHQHSEDNGPETSMGADGSVDTDGDRDSNASSITSSFPAPPAELDIETMETTDQGNFDGDESPWITTLDDERRY